MRQKLLDKQTEDMEQSSDKVLVSLVATVIRYLSVSNETVMCDCLMKECVSRKAQYKNVYRRSIETPQHIHILKANWCLKDRDLHLKLASNNFGIRDGIGYSPNML